MTTDSTPSASNSPNPTTSSVTVNSGNDVNEIQTQIIHHSSSPSPSSSTPTPQPSTSHPSSDIENDIDPVDNARSAASISNLINHDVEQRVNSSPKSQPTSQLSSRSISPVPPETPHNIISGNDQRLSDIEFHNTNNSSLTKKKRKGDHDNDENDIGNNEDFDSSKRQRKNLSSGERISDDNVTTKFNNNNSVPSSPITTGFDELMIDDHNSDDYPVANSPTQISSSSMGNNINFATKQTRKKPYIPRPPNSFILYRQHHHPLILNQHPGINNSEISRIIADHWRNLSSQDKEEWKRKADEAKERHMKAWPDYKYQPRRRVVGPTFKKPIKGPGAPSNTTKSDAFSAQEGMMDNFVIELSPRKIDHNDNLMDSRERRFQGKSVIIIEGGSKELKDRNGNNSPRKPSPAEAIKAKLGSPYPSHVTQRLPPPCTLVPPQLQPLPSPQQPQTMILPMTPTSSSTITSPGSPRGALIVLEGCEDSTTLRSNHLYDFLKNEGIKAKLWKFPDTSYPSGNALKAYQSTNRQSTPKMLHLLVAAHWWELIPKMREQLMNGITLIVDRYVNSAIAESVAAGLDLPWCKTSYAQSLNPDLIFFLNVEREASEIDKQKLSQMPQLSLPHVSDVLGISNNNVDDGRIMKESQRRIQDALSRLVEAQWKILDARKSNTIVNAQIITASIEVIEKCRKSNPGYDNTIMSHQNQQLPPLVPTSSQQSQYPPVNVSSSPQPNHSLLPLSHQQQQNSNVLPPIGRHDFSRSVHVQL